MAKHPTHREAPEAPEGKIVPDPDEDVGTPSINEPPPPQQPKAGPKPAPVHDDDDDDDDEPVHKKRR